LKSEAAPLYVGIAGICGDCRLGSAHFGVAGLFSPLPQPHAVLRLNVCVEARENCGADTFKANFGVRKSLANKHDGLKAKALRFVTFRTVLLEFA
jgi:hypothetical protein